MPIIPNTQEVEIWMMKIQGSRPTKAKKSYRDPISTNKPDMVIHALDPNYIRGIGRRIVVQGQPRRKSKTSCEK
jgi:hypothetical protein